MILKGSTDVTRYVMLREVTTGEPIVGATITALTMGYIRNRSTPNSATASALAAVNSAHSDNNMKEIDAANMPGLYRADFPDAAFATGADKVVLTISGPAIDPFVEEIELVNLDTQDGTRLGLLALPNAAAEASGGLPTIGTSTGQIALATGQVTVGTNNDKAGYDLAADAINPTTIEDGALTNVKLAAGAIAAVNLASDVPSYIRTVKSGTTTSNGASDGSTLISTALNESTANYWRNAWCLITSGSNAGLCRRVSIFSFVSDRLTFSPAFPTQVVSGVTFEMLPAAGTLPIIGNGSVTTGGSTTTLIDTAMIGKTSQVFRGCMFLLTGGSNVGETRQVTGFDGTTGTYTFDHAFSASVSTGTTYEILPSGSDWIKRDAAGHVYSDVQKLVTVAQSAIDLKDFADDGYDPATNLVNSTGAPTAAQVADAVWDEARAGHVAAGSFGEGVIVVTNNDKTGYALAVAPATAGEVADAVWDEARSGHTTAGTFGQGVASVTGAVGSVTAGVTVTTNNDKSGYALATPPPTVDAIADAVWDEARAGHVAAGSFGQGVATVVGGVTVTTNNDKTGYSLTVTPPTAGAIADAVWDEDIVAAHGTADTAGRILKDLSLTGGGELTAQDVWEYATRTLTSGTGGGATAEEVWEYATRTLTAGATASEIADAVWDEARAGHVAAGSFGEGVASVTGAVGSVTAGVTVTTNNDKTGYSLTVSPPTAGAVADAVWDEARADHTGAGSFGQGAASVIGAVGSVTAGVTVTTNNDKSGYSLTVSPPTAGVIADAVWDEARSGHTTAGTFGQGVASVAGAVGSVTAGVTVTTNSDKTGYSLATAPPTVNEIVDGVWDEIITSGHVVSGSAAEVLNAVNAGSGSITAEDVWEYANRSLTDADIIANSVWDELVEDHSSAAGAFGEAIFTMLADIAALPSLITASWQLDATETDNFKTFVSANSQDKTIQDLTTPKNLTITVSP